MLHSKIDDSLENGSGFAQDFSEQLLQLWAGAPKSGPNIVVLFGVSANAETSPLAVELARFARSVELSVLLVDANIDGGSQHGAFGCEQTPGLASALLGKAAFDDIIQIGDGGLSLIPAGSDSSHSCAILYQVNVADRLRSLAKSTDLIIVDAATLNLRASIQIASGADQAIVVIRRNQSSLRELQAIVALAGANLPSRPLVIMDDPG